MYPYTIGSQDTITVFMDGKTRMVRKDHPNYQKVLDALVSKDWEAIPDLIDKARAVEKASEGKFKVVDGQVIATDFNGHEFKVPSGLNGEILKYQNLGLDYGRLLLFAQRLMENPSYRAVNQLFSWIHRGGLTITEDGKFIAYRGVMKVTDENRADVDPAVRTATYVDWYSKSNDNSVGKTVSMPRNHVNEDPNSSCSQGLHAATYDYAHRHYHNGKPDGETLFIEICPSDVVAVPNGEPDKMRVCKYVVKGVSAGPIEEPQYDECHDTDPCLEPPNDEAWGSPHPQLLDDEYDDEEDEDDDYWEDEDDEY